jgi:holo-[acyl-carrier protein] synthase
MNDGFAASLQTLLSNLRIESATKLAVGIDIESVPEFRALLGTKGGAAMIQRNFSPSERDYCDGRPDRLAGRWAAKEAVAKAVGTGFRGISPRDIEITRLASGQPVVAITPSTRWPNDAHDWQWSISISHEADAAAAIAVAVRQNSGGSTE